MKMRLKAILFLGLLFFSKTVWPQSNNIYRVNGVPTREIYDLHVDSKGFLWICHDRGICRYDGVSFKPYTSPDQISLSTSNIIEDKQGRIWFINFSAQIFYIENEQMHLLKAYESKKETTFPRIAICGDQLIASSERGLFVCDTKDLNCRYVPCSNAPGKGTTSFTLLNNTIIAYGYGNWFVYHKGGSLKMSALYGDSTRYIGNNGSYLNVTAYRDTALMFSNPEGVLSKIVLKDDSLKLIKAINIGRYINTISIDSNRAWINTIQNSYILGQEKHTINGIDISAIVTDKEGNTWYSSLKRGLLVKYNDSYGTLTTVKLVKDDDMIKCIDKKGDTLLTGTQNGSIILYNAKNKRKIKEIILPGNPESVNYLHHLGGDDYLVGTSVNTYELNIKTGTSEFYPGVKALKQADTTADLLFSASSNGLTVIPRKKRDFFDKNIYSMFSGIQLRHDINGDSYYFKMRCRAVCYDPVHKAIFAAFKDGLVMINKSGIKPFDYNDAVVNATCLKYVNGKVIIGTVGDGLLITDGADTKNITVNEGLSSNTILKIKRTGDWLWILSAGATKVLDVKDLKFINIPNLSSLAETEVFDVEKIDNEAYVVTADSLYMLPLNKTLQLFRLKNYLEDVSVNNKTLPPSGSHFFDYYENNIQFKLTVPYYYHANEIYFKYLLTGANDQNWQVTSPGDRNLTFSELSPGKYTLTAYAVHPQFGMALKPVIYKFSIAEKWWQTWLFKAGITLLVALFLSYIVYSYFQGRLRAQRILFEKQLAIQNERQRISGEMHDDVGAGLSAIKLFLNMALEQNPSKDLVYIGGMINDMVEKINEIIWSINSENDTVESLLNYVQYQAFKLFKHATLSFDAIIPVEIPQIMISGQERQHIYLIIKEILHNALKHAQATSVHLNIKVDGNNLLVSVKDNGKGFNPSYRKPNANGIRNIKKRMQELDGKMTIDTDGAGTAFALTIPLAQHPGQMGYLFKKKPLSRFSNYT